MAKFIAVLALIIVVIAGMYYFMPDLFGSISGSPATSSSATTTTARTYSSSAYDVSFSYPHSYTLIERDTDETPPVHVVTLADTEALQGAPRNGEGPTSITLSIFSATTTSAAEWVRGSTASNFQLSSDGAITSTTVGGEEAVRYSSDGLYATDNVVLMRGSRVYMFSVGWLSRDDQIVADFEALLATVRFE